MSFGSKNKGKAKHSNYGLGTLWRETAALPTLSKSGMVWHLAVQAWKSFLSSPVTSILTVITIATTLLVFAVFILLIENVRDLVSVAQSETSVSLYLRETTNTVEIDALFQEIKQLKFVEEAKFKSKKQSLEEFSKELGDKALILEGLESSNPLPASISIKFKVMPDMPDPYSYFSDTYSSHPLVEHVEYSRGLVARLSNLLKFLRLAGSISIVFMLIITAFIITNTIKLALYSHREEIEIMKLVGATDAFVRAPYMIEGFFQGLIGGIASLLVSYTIFLFVQDSLQANEILRVFLPNIHFLSWFSIFLVILAGIAVGICGSYWAVKKFIVS